MTVDELKNMYPIRSIIGKYGLTISPNGYIHCPFHNDKHPSLKIYEGTNSWFCFSCNRGGDIFNFIMEMEKVDFPVAVKIIAGNEKIEGSKSNEHNQEKLYDYAFKKLLKERNYWISIKEKEKPIYDKSIINISDLYATACKKIPLLEAEMDELLNKNEEKRNERFINESNK